MGTGKCNTICVTSWNSYYVIQKIWRSILHQIHTNLRLFQPLFCHPMLPIDPGIWLKTHFDPTKTSWKRYICHVNHFCRIFVLYFVALILMPCTDIHASDPASFGASITTEHDSCPHEKETDFCSPFCICSCCGQVVLVTVTDRDQARKSNTFMVESELISTDTPSFQSEYLDRLFHPPKV